MDVLKYAVIHELRKRGSEAADTHLAAHVLDTKDSTVRELADVLVKVLGTPNNNVHYGQFRGAHRQGEFPGSVENFASDDSAKLFMVLSHITMNELVLAANNRNFSTGGYICFLAYASQDSDFLLVAMVKEKSGFLVDVNLKPTSVQPIDLSKLHQAARINLSRYLEVLASVHAADADASPITDDLDLDEDGDTDSDGVDQTYLCFIKGTADEVAAYFQDALGCEPGISASRATSRLIREIPKFLHRNKETREYALQSRRVVIDYLLSFTNEAPIDLGTVVSVVRAAIPTSMPDDLVEALNKHLNEKCEIPSHFMVHGATVKREAVIKVKGPQYSLVFEENAVDEQDAPILYNRASRSLTIRSLDPKVVERVENAINARRREVK